MSRTLVAVFALLAAGCTTFDLDDAWTKPNTGGGQTSRDDWSCRREVDDSATRTEDVYVGGVADAVRVLREERFRDETYAKCMTARGYTRTTASTNPLARLVR